jgi:hypothetical protein
MFVVAHVLDHMLAVANWLVLVVIIVHSYGLHLLQMLHLEPSC